MKRILLTLLVLLILAVVGSHAQVYDDFAGANHVVANDRYGWKSPTGTSAASTGSIEIVGDGTAIPYHASGPINYGFVYRDTVYLTSTEFYMIVPQKGGTNNTRYLGMGAAVSTNWTAASGYFGGFQEMLPGTDGGVDRYNLKRMDGTMPSLGGSNPSDFAATTYIRSELAPTDTLGATVWVSNNRFTIWKAAVGGARETLSTAAGQHNFAGGYYWWWGGAELTTPIAVTEVGVRAAGGAAPPAGSPDNSAPDAMFTLSTASAFLGNGVTVSVAASEDSALNQSIVEVDTGVGGYHTITTNTYAGTVTSGSFTSASFTRYTAGNATVRVRTSDHNKNNAAIRWDTTAAQTVNFTQAPVLTQSNKRVLIWATFDNTKWSATYNGGTVLADSFPWAVMTHVSLFAANGAVPANTTYPPQYGPMATAAHARGVDAGLCTGGSSDGALVSMVNAGPASHAAWIAYYLQNYVDPARLDFVDFDFETFGGSGYNTAQLTAFLSSVYDSLNAAWRYSGNNPSRKPYMVLTLSVPNSIALASQTIRDRTEFLNIMSYDYNNNAWGRVTFDNSPKSYLYYNGTGGATDSVGSGVNAVAPSMQRMAMRVAAAGWPMNKINVGVDFNGGSWGYQAGMFPKPRDPLTGMTGGGSNATFSGNWANGDVFSVIPSDSIFFDQIAQAYWFRKNNRLWTIVAMPGRDSGIIATRKVIDSMGIGGVCFWNGGTEVYTNSGPVPAGGRYWHFNMIEDRFSGIVDTTVYTLNPPTAPTAPAIGATGVAQSTTIDWPNITGASKYWLKLNAVSVSQAGNVNDSTLTSSQRAVTGLQAGVSYIWQVSVQNANGVWGPWSDPWTFTVIPAVPGAPTITAPVSGTTVSNANSVVVAWSAATDGPTTYVNGQSYYNVQVSTTPGFSSIAFADSGFNATVTRLSTVTGITGGQTYYVRARARTVGGYGPWSASTTFITPAVALLPPPTQVYPGNNAFGMDTVNLSLAFGTVVGATKYRVQVSYSPQFGNLLVDDSVAASPYIFADLAAYTTYWWRVASVNSAGTGAYGTALPFITTGPVPIQVGPTGPHYTAFRNDPVSGQWTGQGPIPWFDYIEGDSDLNFMPMPTDSHVVRQHPLGNKSIRYGVRKTSVTNGAGQTFTVAALKDSLRNSPDKDGVPLSNPVVLGQLSYQSNQVEDPNAAQPRYPTAGWDQFTGSRDIRLGWPSRSGTPILGGDNATLSSLELTSSRLSPKSGGLGYMPTEARDAGTGTFFWGFSPSDTNFWTIFPLSALRTQYGILTNSGITGPKQPYLDANGQWQFRDTASGGGTNLGDAAPDTVRSSVYMDDSGKVNTSNAAGTWRGYYGYNPSPDAVGIWVPNSNNAAWLGSLNDGSGVSVTDQQGVVDLQTTAAERTHRNRKSYTNSDPVEDLWQYKATTTNNSGLVASYVRLDSASSSTEDYAGYYNRPNTFIVYIDVVAARTDAAGYAAYSRRIVADNNAGTVTIRATDTIGTDVESNANTGIGVAMGGANSDGIQTTVTGDTGQTWVWNVTYRIVALGNASSN